MKTLIPLTGNCCLIASVLVSLLITTQVKATHSIESLTIVEDTFTSHIDVAAIDEEERLRKDLSYIDSVFTLKRTISEWVELYNNRENDRLLRKVIVAHIRSSMHGFFNWIYVYNNTPENSELNNYSYHHIYTMADSAASWKIVEVYAKEGSQLQKIASKLSKGLKKKESSE